MALVVIGGVAAGLSAAARARRIDPRLDIVVLEKGPVISYGACGLPYFVEGRVREAKQLIVHTPEYFRKERNIEVRTGARAIAISHPRREVVLDVSPVPLGAALFAQVVQEALHGGCFERRPLRGWGTRVLLFLRQVRFWISVEEGELRERVLLVADIESFSVGVPLHHALQYPDLLALEADADAAAGPLSGPDERPSGGHFHGH